MYFVGSVIKREREKYKITQEELCFGICSVSTLSRIENNGQTPSMEKAMALLSRLGLEGSTYMSFVSEEEYRFYDIRSKVEEMLSKKQYEAAYSFTEGQRDYLQKNVFRKQFLLTVEAVKLCYIDKQYETAIGMTEEALQLTCPRFEKAKKIRYLLTDIEIDVINLMAVSYWKSSDAVEAIRILTNLTEAVRELYEPTERRKNIYPLVLCNLTKWLCHENRLQEADSYITLGRRACIQSGKFRMLPYFSCCRAEILQKTNCSMELVLSEFIDAYVLFRSMELTEDAAALRSYVLTMYNRDLENIKVCDASNPI